MNMRRVMLGVAALLCLVVVLMFGAQTEARVLIGAMTLFALMFAALYGFRSPWRSTEAGKTLMFTALALAAIGLQQLSVWWFGDYVLRNEVRALTITALVLAMLHRILVLRESQRAAREAEL
ncbi:putative phage holin [Rhodococcus sp. SJ-2]